MEQFIWKKLGISSNFSIEERLFMSTTFLMSISMVLLALPIYLFYHSGVAFYFLFLGVGLFCNYSVVRYWRKLVLAKILLFVLSLAFAQILFPITAFLKGPVIYGMLLYFLMSLATASSTLEQRLHLAYVVLLGAYLIFVLTPLPDTITAGIYYLIYLSFALIFYLGTVYLKQTYDYNTKQLSEKSAKLQQLSQKMEQQIIETQELAAQKDRLFSIIGHDLRSPLSGIEGFLNVMEHGGVPENERRIMSKELLRLTRNSRALLDNLLRWAKRDTKAYQATRVDYPKLIQMVGEHLSPLADSKGISLKVLIDDGEGSVYGDADMLEMIIRNLISNAIKFTASGGWIKIRAYELESELRLEVEDNGIGMTEEQRSKLFSPHREVGLGTNREKGVGLGLMLCAEFLSYMNGTIEVRSVKDKGSCFTVHIPRKKGQAED